MRVEGLNALDEATHRGLDLEDGLRLFVCGQRGVHTAARYGCIWAHGAVFGDAA